MKDEERKKEIKIENMFVDVGATSEEEVKNLGIEIGTPITTDREFTELAGTRVTGKALDNRVGVAMLIRAFEYYESSAYAFPRKDVAGRPIDSEQTALEAIADASGRIEHAARRRHLALNVLAEDPVLQHALPLSRYGALDGSGWGATSLWTIYDWLERSDAVRARIADLAATAESRMVRDQANIMLALVGGGELENLAANPSFEEPGAWNLWVKEETGRMLYSEDVAHSGTRSILCDGMRRGGPYQSIKLEPGRYAAVCFVYTPEGQAASGTVELAITPRDGAGNNLPGLSTTVVPEAGRWLAVATGGDIPAQISGKDVAGALFLPIVNGFKEGDKLYIDDIALFRLGDIEQ